MGIILATFRAGLAELWRLNQAHNEFLQRVRQSPGLPCPNPTKSFWMIPPADLPMSHPEDVDSADVVILGSGITAAGVAKVLLERGDGLKIVIVEARDICSGATGRNGGHVWPNLFDEYVALKKRLGKETAQSILRFRRAHIDAYKEAGDELLRHAQFREVEAIECSFDKAVWESRRRKFMEWKADMPAEAELWRIYESQEASETFKLSSQCFGAIAGPAAAMSPYRFVTGLILQLTKRFPQQLSLLTESPCTKITAPAPNSDNMYTVVLGSGDNKIHTSCIVHATNGSVSHLLPKMREKIFPVRATMTAQRPGRSMCNSTLKGQRSYVFIGSSAAFDYLTQLPDGSNELMFGGGLGKAGNDGLDELGVAKDDNVDLEVCSHLSGALPIWFGLDHWGAEAEPKADLQNDTHPGRLKAYWSGTVAFSADGLPWVGAIPADLSGRPWAESDTTLSRLKPSGEWISAGYTGEGMTLAYLCGQSLGSMLLKEDEQNGAGFIPDSIRISKQRYKTARLDQLLDNLRDLGH